MRQDTENRSSTHIGSIFLILVFLICAVVCLNLADDVRGELRDWFKAVGSGLVPFAIFYLTQQTNERDRLDRKEQEELSSLQYYFDKISTLVIEQKLTDKNNVTEEVQIARALTAHTLRLLSTDRINQVSDFLYSMNLCRYEESHKIDHEQDEVLKPISLLYQIQLEGAVLKGWKARFRDLSHAILKNADLSNASFMGSNLSYAYLQHANLENVNFQNANLNGTFLSQHLTEEQQKQCKIYEPCIKLD